MVGLFEVDEALSASPLRLGALHFKPSACDVGLWHQTDLPRYPQFGRYRGGSGHGGCERRLPKLTHSGHCELDDTPVFDPRAEIDCNEASTTLSDVKCDYAAPDEFCGRLI